MNNEVRLLILFPEDPSTVFLEEVIQYISQKAVGRQFRILKIGPRGEDHALALKEIGDKSFNTVLFLGHGNSHSLSGSCSGTFRRDKFLSIGEFSVFGGKDIILVSCNSSTLLQNARKSGFNRGIGFGDLPTDWNDVCAARECDGKAYQGIEQATLDALKKDLVIFTKYSIEEFLSKGLTLKELFHILQLRINNKIANLYMENSKIPALTDCLLAMKQEISYIEG